MFAGLHATVLEAFTYVKVFLVNEHDNTEALQNIILAVYNSGYGHDNYPITEYRGAFSHKIAAFTDRFAPVERYTLDMVR